SDVACRSLAVHWDDDADAFLQAGENVRALHHVVEMRRTDLFFTFADEDEVHRQFATRFAHRIERGEEGCFRTLLVGRAAADADFAKAGLVDQAAFERWGRPFLRIELLHVVHEVDAERFRRADVVGRIYAGGAAGRHDFGVLEARIERELLHIFRA